MTRPLVVAMANHKGGIGKTSSTLGFAEAAVASGLRVGAIDLDPNCTLTEALDPAELDVAGSKDVLRDDRSLSLAECWVPAGEQWSGIQVCISDIKLSNREYDLTAPASERRLRDAIDRGTGDVDVILIDLPPNRSRIALAGLVAADHVLALTACTTFSTRLLSQLLDDFIPVGRQFNNQLNLAGILITKFAGRAEENRIYSELVSIFGDQVWQPPIPRHEIVATAYESFHTPLRQMRDPYAERVADAYAGHLPKLLAAGGLSLPKGKRRR